MKKKQFTALAKLLLPDLPSGIVVKDEYIFVRPLNDAIRGFCFEGSSFDADSFYLYVPTEVIHFTFGDRVRDESADRWDNRSPELVSTLSSAMREQGLPIVDRAATLEGQIGAASAVMASCGHPSAREAVAYGLARLGRKSEALAALESLISTLDRCVSWQSEMAERAERFRDMLIREPERATATLDAWREDNIRRFRLDALY
jgi:hypothetical protein